MVDWWWMLVALYVGVSTGMWFIMTIRDGAPVENLSAFLWPIMLLGALSD